MTAWSDGERSRFEAGVLEALADDGIRAALVPGSLRVVIGGSAATGAGVIVTWANRGNGRIDQRRHTIAPARIAGILHNAADKLTGAPADGS